ncbi:hypothetical protein MKW94_017129 [Papaver nudicaule]|uniref:DNA polymerase epsilon subunit B N-terminal domain-containing protein n=1 Tax=Papaver nudicaule TaxID=74823 RepID=A0AA41VQC0_PAPNU|nr:hypothetical protein [Papaver nudicaule]
MAVGAIRKKVLRKFKLRGYILNTDALEEILSFLTQFEDQEDEAIEILLDEINKESLNSSVLDRDSVHRVISLLLEAESAVEASPSSSNRSHFRILDSFIIPKFCYDSTKKTFYERTGKLPIHGDASSKAALYRDRFQLLHQRLSRDPHFAKPAFDYEFTRSVSREISPIQSLIGQTGRRWIMGVISQLEDSGFYLEDTSAAVKVDLSDAISLTEFHAF